MRLLFLGISLVFGLNLFAANDTIANRGALRIYTNCNLCDIQITGTVLIFNDSIHFITKKKEIEIAAVSFSFSEIKGYHKRWLHFIDVMLITGESYTFLLTHKKSFITILEEKGISRLTERVKSNSFEALTFDGKIKTLKPNTCLFKSLKIDVTINATKEIIDLIPLNARLYQTHRIWRNEILSIRLKNNKAIFHLINNQTLKLNLTDSGVEKLQQNGWIE